MKKILLGCTFLTLMSAAFSQDIRFGIQAGTAIASQKAKQSGISITSDGKVGFTVGVTSDISIAESFTFQPSLNFTQKGSKFNVSDGSESMESSQTLNYIELPLNFLYHAPAGKGKFFAGLGPVVNYGISGKAKVKMGGESMSEDINFGSNEDEDDYKPFEFSGNILAGYEFSNGVFVAANYNAGLSNIAVGGDSDNSLKNRYFGVKLGFKFGGAAAK
jgi:hypothetical protein